MTYQEVMKAIQAGDLASVYLISGEETYLADKLEKALLDRLLPGEGAAAADIRSGPVATEELIGLVESAPFFSARNVIVLRDTMLLREKKKAAGETPKENKSEERLIALLERMPPYSTLILRMNEKADKRRKLYKAIAKAGAAVEVAAIRPWEVKDWLGAKLKEIDRRLDREAFAYFLEAVSVMPTISLGFLEQEVDKLALYSDKKLLVKADLTAALASVPEVSVFAMLDAISDKNTARALRLLEEQLGAGEHPLKLAAMLSRHARQLWQAKRLAARGVAGRQMAAELGLVPFIAEKLAAKSRGFEEHTLREALLALAEADYRLKSGQADIAVLERIVIGLCA